MRYLTKLLVFIFALTLSCAAFPSEKINRLIIFGDSLSDNGNLYRLLERLHEISDVIPIIPASQLYWNGRFSNGPVWAEFLAGILQFMPNTFTPEQRSSKHYQNFAYGGAWAETLQPDKIKKVLSKSSLHLLPPSLSQQVDDYLLRNIVDRQHILQHDLIFIWIGGNDYLNQVDGIPVARSSNQSTDAVIAVVQKNILKLIADGASHFVLMGLPDLSRTPYIYLRDPQAQSLAPEFAITSLLHNQKLKQLVADLRKKYSTVHFDFLDLNQLFEDEYMASNERAIQYSKIHSGDFQKSSTPCILEWNDPDPTIIQFFQLNPLLALTIAPKRLLEKMATPPYSHCDLHQAGDQKSIYNSAEDYEAGGIFFDHIHPLTHLHAKIALVACQQIALQGYLFLQPNSADYRKINCNDFSVMDLVNHISDPPFPLNP